MKVGGTDAPDKALEPTAAQPGELHAGGGGWRRLNARPFASADGRRDRRSNTMDEDVEQMSPEQLIAEVKRLRQGIRQHRDSTGHELCWHHPALWGLLPEATDPLPTIPDWPQFLRGCIRYRQSLDEQAPEAPRTDASYEG
jgi:hypothetical protein